MRLAVMASAHSQRFCLSGYALGPLSNEQVIAIGTDLVRLFEARYEDAMKAVPPGSPEAPKGETGGRRLRLRERGQ